MADLLETQRTLLQVQLLIAEARMTREKKLASGTIWSMNLYHSRIGAASEQGALWPVFGWTMHMEYYPLVLFK